MIPGENKSWENRVTTERKSCRHCGVEIFQLFNGNWAHLGRHGYQNYIQCLSSTVAAPQA